VRCSFDISLGACGTRFSPHDILKPLRYAGVLSLIFGALIFCYAVINLGRSFSPLITPRKNNKIVKTGLYQYMRHPLYTGLIMLAFGLSAVFGDESRLMLACLLAFVLVRFLACKCHQCVIRWRCRRPICCPLLALYSTEQEVPGSLCTKTQSQTGHCLCLTAPNCITSRMDCTTGWSLPAYCHGSRH
jgi:hypothetical protein